MVTDSTSGFRTTQRRRHFLQAAIGVGSGLVLLSGGVLVTLFRYFRRFNKAEEAEITRQHLQFLEKSSKQDQLALARQMESSIFIGQLSALSSSKGMYFTDYEMNPALAFLDKDNLPLLISAKCTHLGCTVGSDVDNKGKILCPCHISYFDIYSGEPSAGSPAKAPLPHLGWVLKDKSGQVVASKSVEGEVTGKPDLKDPGELSVYITKPADRNS